MAERTVSIPFKRESISKVSLRCGTVVVESRVVSIPFKRESISKEASQWSLLIEVFKEVSIPFKRESISKAVGFFHQRQRYSLFQFPSNGKVYPKCTSPSRGVIGLCHVFQFPSNGKVYPK